MHYYQFNIGDYQSHTGHLEPLEDCAYRRMLDWCYLHERPLPDDVQQIAKLIRMRSHSDCIATVLQEFFVRTAGGWWQDRIGKEITKAGEKSRKASDSAKSRWLKTNEKSDANALQPQSEGNTTQDTIHNTQDTEVERGAKAPRPTKRRLPDAWLLPKAWGQWAMQEYGLDEQRVRSEADKFRDHWLSTGEAKLDWEATWRNWIRRSLEMTSAAKPEDKRRATFDALTNNIFKEGGNVKLIGS